MEEGAGAPTCANRSSPFQQQLEAVGLVVESGAVHSTVPVRSLGVQMTSGGGGSGRKEGQQTGEGSKSGERRRERNEGEYEEVGGRAGRFSPILDDEIHQGQGGLVGDSDGQVQGELSGCLGTQPHL